VGDPSSLLAKATKVLQEALESADTSGPLDVIVQFTLPLSPARSSQESQRQRAQFEARAKVIEDRIAGYGGEIVNRVSLGDFISVRVTRRALNDLSSLDFVTQLDQPRRNAQRE
jgi:hypothetical protein